MQALDVVPAEVKADVFGFSEIEALYRAVLEISRPLEEHSIKGGLILKSGIVKLDISIELRILEDGVSSYLKLFVEDQLLDFSRLLPFIPSLISSSTKLLMLREEPRRPAGVGPGVGADVAKLEVAMEEGKGSNACGGLKSSLGIQTIFA